MKSFQTTDFVHLAKGIAPIVCKNAATSELSRKVPDETIDAMANAGLFKLAIPKRYGGYETNIRTLVEVSSAIAECDGSAAWVLTIMNACAWITSLFPEKAQQEVFGNNPAARVAGVPTPNGDSTKVQGGHLVSGKWFYSSGGWHAQWVLLGFPVKNGQGETIDHGIGLIPVDELSREDTWFVAGMKGTGSICFIADNIFVPDHRIISMPAALEGKYATEFLEKEVLYRSAFVPVAIVVLAGPLLGLGKAALAYVMEKAASKGITSTFFERQNLSVAFQLQVAEAAVLIDTAYLHAFRAADEIDNAAQAGVFPDRLHRIRQRTDTVRAAECITKAIDILLYAHGTGSFAENNPLQRIWRDAAIAARHAILLPAVSYEVYGKALLGVEEKITPFV